ncbi:MAG: PRC-barrel domain-containing protein [Streptosporangiaceae bacterium]
MTGTTLFTIGADAVCTDGACGKLTCVVVDPVAQAVTHLVVERHGLERLVPLDLADAARGEIQLGCTLAGFDELPPAVKTEFLPGSHNDTDYGPDQVLTSPYYGLADSYGIHGRGVATTVTHYTLPLGEVAVRRGERVHATDGTVGQVQGLVIDPGNHHVTHVLLQEGHLFGRKEVAIPISAVTHVDSNAYPQADSNGVQLSLTKHQVQDLPPVDIDHPGG